MSAESTQALEEEVRRLRSLLAISKPTSFASPPSVPFHALLLLSDSALPLGSFAFSSGLESYLAHNDRLQSHSFLPFLSLSLLSLASTSLPYVLAAHRAPHCLGALDSTLDACILCPVARRASVAQGRALLTIWERAFHAAAAPSTSIPYHSTTTSAWKDAKLTVAAAAREALARFGAELKVHRGGMKMNGEVTTEHAREKLVPNGHFAPLWAVIACAMAVTERDAIYVFLLNHAKAVVSAAVRASVMGPYQAQGVLASGWLCGEIERVMDANWDLKVEDAGQTVPVMDLWVGRHEMLYSRIFNS